MKKISLLPRWVHKLYAQIFGYFWLPCPLCNRYFGGHEADITLMDGGCVCPVCSGKANQLNRKWWDNYFKNTRKETKEKKEK